MHPEDKIDHILIPELKLAFLTDNRWHPVHLPSVQAVRCTRFLDRENLAAYRARLRFNERAAAELLEHRRFPDLCKQTDEDAEQGYKAFEIRKGRFSFRLTAPYSDLRRRAASEAAKIHSGNLKHAVQKYVL